MTEQELIELCSLGESTTVQYKLEFTTPKQVAEELVAFANTRGGIIVFGAEDKTGKLVGLTYEQAQYISRELGNTANDQVRPVIYLDTETVKHNGVLFLITYIKSGAYKPYKDLSGNIWVKQGADKRRVTENAEIRRLLQNSHQYQVDMDGVDGNQFVARIWLTDQKSEITTQKELDALDSTTQKKETTARKPLNTTQKRILDYLRSYPKATRQEIADALGDITESGVKFNLGLLQQHGYLRRRNGRKDGYWEIIE